MDGQHRPGGRVVQWGGEDAGRGVERGDTGPVEL
jgi:hypothetical protein